MSLARANTFAYWHTSLRLTASTIFTGICIGMKHTCEFSDFSTVSTLSGSGCTVGVWFFGFISSASTFGSSGSIIGVLLSWFHKGSGLRLFSRQAHDVVSSLPISIPTSSASVFSASPRFWQQSEFLTLGARLVVGLRVCFFSSID